MLLYVAILLPVNFGEAQSDSKIADDFQQTLINAERAIMEDLSAQSVGATPAEVRIIPSKQNRPVVAVAPKELQKVQVPVLEKRKIVPVPIKAAPAPTATENSAKNTALLRENETFRKELASLRAHITRLEKDLRESKTQATMTETELSRLTSMLDEKTRASLSRYNMVIPVSPKAPVKIPLQVPTTLNSKAISDVKPPSSDVALQIATVTVDKADLRLGPGKNNSALMSLRRGSRLAVEERQGEWYRVFAPNGQRAWIHSSLIRFGDGASNLNDGSAVSIKGFSTNAEEEAFRRLQKISGTR